jgi:anti-anti-sigma factor
MITSLDLPGRHVTVLELHDVVDIDNQAVLEKELRLMLPGCGPRSVVIDIRTRLVTAAALHMLLRLWRTAQARGISLGVAARHPAARRIFRITGLSRTLRVAATPAGAAALTRTCTCTGTFSVSTLPCDR